jgi:hypothetical protein
VRYDSQVFDSEARRASVETSHGGGRAIALHAANLHHHGELVFHDFDCVEQARAIVAFA